MEKRYNGNGRAVLTIEQKRNQGRSWQEMEYTVRTPDGTFNRLTADEVVTTIMSYKNPVLDINRRISGKAKRYFREQANRAPPIPLEFVYQEV